MYPTGRMIIEKEGEIKVFRGEDIRDSRGRIDMDFFNTLMRFQYGTGKDQENAAAKLFSDKRGAPASLPEGSSEGSKESVKKKRKHSRRLRPQKWKKNKNK